MDFSPQGDPAHRRCVQALLDGSQAPARFIDNSPPIRSTVNLNQRFVEL
jgi:hypothetical protein